MAQGNFGQGEGTLSKAAEMVREAKGDFDNLASQLSSQIDGARAQWKGQGGNAFFALHQAWTEKQRTVVSALNEFESSLRSTEKDNVSTDDTQSQNFAGFQNRLG
ncbi:WXG100 family type VII secretion target [Nocardioides insulae]|uniref:WXG100 family type VII secretion target n=1 Tax=Nocardioides insulae TaxID=394734 RepID=UPI00040B647A|nr:WXG100 family type VII secretion target [Nocardioides insulae]